MSNQNLGWALLIAVKKIRFSSLFPPPSQLSGYYKYIMPFTREGEAQRNYNEGPNPATKILILHQILPFFFFFYRNQILL